MSKQRLQEADNTQEELYQLQKNGRRIPGGDKVQVDNGAEFVNDEERTDKLSLFQKIAEGLGMQIRRTRPYSPWQNGKVERSHHEEGKILYRRKVFTSETELKKQVQKYEDRYNRTAKTSLDFKSPD